MASTPEPIPRFPSVSRRAFLRRSAMVGLAAAAAPVVASCAASASNQSSQGGNANPPTPAPSSTVAPSDSAAAIPEMTSGTAESALGAASQLEIDFTYQASGGGRVHSPYIAVWIEDQAGELVQAVSLWFKSDESKYLRDLRRWSSKNANSALTTGATRIPGSFTVGWDGTDLNGSPITGGDYFVCLEAAREDGPYQLIREQVSLTPTLNSTPLTPNGELTAASIRLVA